MKFKELYYEIGELVEEDKISRGSNIGDHLCKLFEEAGEFAQEANKYSGRKKMKEDEDFIMIDEKLTEEAADAVQCIIAILRRRHISFKEFKKALSKKNKAYAKYLELL